MEIIRIRVQMNGEKTALTNLKQIDAKIDEINKKKVSVNINTKDAANAKNAVNDLGTAAGNTAKQSKILGDTLSMIKFTAIAAAIGGVTTALHSALSEMKAVDTQLTNIQKVSNMTSQELDRLGDKAYSTASKYGVAADEYLSAVYTFQKAGLGDAADQLGELATKTMLVGDTSADVASKFLIATNAAWNMQGSMSALSTVVDEADYINNNYATSLDKLAAAMPIVASTAANMNMSVEQTMAAVGTMQSLTQDTGTKIGTAWRALIMNITGEIGEMMTDTGEQAQVTADTIQSLTDAMQYYGNDAVKAAQKTGEIINPMEALNSLADAYREGLLTDIELENILMDVGGKLRTNPLTALVKDLASDDATGQVSMYRSMLEGMAEAAGTADAEIGVMLSSWESKTKILSNTWTEFVQKSMSSDSIKGLLDTATNLLDVMDNLGLAAKAVGGILVFAFGRQISSGVSSLVNNVANLVTGLRSGATAATMFQSALGWIGLATAAISGITMAVREYRERQIEAAQAEYDAANKRVENLDSQKERLEQLTTAYKTLAADGITDSEKGQLQKIQDAVNDITDALGDQYEKVDLVNGAYETQKGILQGNLALIQQATQAELEIARASAGKVLQETTKGMYGTSQYAMAYGINPLIFDSRRGKNSFRTTIENGELAQVSVNFGETAESIVKAYDDIGKAVERMQKIYSADDLVGDTEIGEMYEWLTGMQSALAEAVKNYQDAVAAADPQRIEEAAGAVEDALDGVGGSAGDAADDVESSVRRIDAAMQQLRDVMNGPQRSDDFDNYVEALRIFREEVEAGRVNSNAFWSSAEFLLGADVVAKYADNAAGLVQLVEDSQLDEVFGEITDAEGKAVTGIQNFVDALLEAADESGRVAGGAAKITGEPGDYKIAIKNVQALADAWDLPVEAIYAAMEALGDYGEFDLSDSALTDYLEWLGVTFDELGKTDFTSVVNTLSGLGYPAQDITTIVQQLQNMNAIDMQGFAGTLEDVNTALGKVSSTSKTAADNVASIDGQTTGNVTNQIYTLSGALSGATAAADATRSSINKLNGTKATTTITTRNITENLVSYSYSGSIAPYNTNNTSGSFIDALKNAGLKGIGYASGTNSAQGGIALVGDERSPDGRPRPELINDNGRMYLAGQFGPEIVRLGRGAQVYTATETRQIMAGGIPAYARGTQSSSNSAGNSLSKLKENINKLISDSGTGTKTTTTKTTTTPTYTISFSANGGSGGPSYISGKSGSKGTIPYSKPSRSGYTFLGWANYKNSSSASYSSGSVITFSGNKTLYAVWRKNQTTPTSGAASVVSTGVTDAVDRAKTEFKNALTADYSGSYSGPTSYTTTTSSGGGGGGGYTTYGGGGGGGGGGSSSSSSSSAEDDALVALKRKADEDLQNREFAIWHGLTAGTMTLPEAVKAYRDAMAAVVDYENEFRKLGEDENSDYIQDLVKQWWGYSDEVKKIQDDLLDELKENIENRLDEAEKVKNQQVDAIEAAAKAEKDLNRLEELRRDLLEAQNALLNAQSERTVRIYNAATGQWEWVADAGTVKSARESVEKAQKSLAEETAEQARAAQIAAIEAEYEKLKKEWDDILSSLEEPGRGIDEIAHDIYDAGEKLRGLGYPSTLFAENEKASAAASRSWTLGDSIAASILAMNGMGSVSSINGKPIMYGASSGVSGGVIVGGTSQAGAGGISYYINGVEISGDRAETMTVADLARSLSTLAIYNNT